MPPASHQHTNRLAHETSPYLLQHAKNPVDWYPWGPEALERAKREDKPILLSIGYAACHWCHVMERESFENEEVAQVMNAHYVCIKVDREERPDIDDIYMSATVAMTGHGGWPMTVFLTPKQQPFYAGTYFPPDDRHGRPGFKTLLERIAELWTSDRTRLTQQAAELTEHVRGRGETLREASVGEQAIFAAGSELAEAFDPEHGGFGAAPKFPPSASLSLLLRLHRRTVEPTLLTIVTTTLDHMKNGGIYDQLAGGFARYSVDEEWLVPHFEKMLYDNAQLARVYLEAYQVTKNDEYRRVAAETLDYVAREMQDAEGGYYSATDADSEGVEGKFFTWAPDQVEEVVGQPAGDYFCRYYDVTPEGNFEGVSILHTPRSMKEVAEELGVGEDELARSLADSRQKLYAARLRRVPPLTDDKILTSWNGLMIGAMAEGARVLGDRRYLTSAERAARFVLSSLARSDGGLYRTARAGKAHLDAYLEDYAFLADGLVDLYEAGGAESFLVEAVRLAERMIADFGGADGGAFYQTANRHEALIARPREGHDGALPSANAVAARLLSRLALHLGRDDLKARALAAIRAYGRAIDQSPRPFATTLSVVDLLLEGPVELAYVGEPASPGRIALEAAVARRYLPNRAIAHGVPAGSAPLSSDLPLLAGKTLVAGQPALYVCRDFACQAPVTKPEDVARALDAAAAELHAGRSRGILAKRLSGRATAEATKAYAERLSPVRGEAAYGPFGTTGLVTSRLGFGTYRVDDRIREHGDALARAVGRGVNLVDTSTNYGDGHSEQLVGRVIADLDREGNVARSAVIVVSKIGYAQGENLGLAEAREQAGSPFPEMVKLGEGLWHCIHPEWLADQLERSLERLGLETLDVCLLHNPEYFLADAAQKGVPLEKARDDFYERVTRAFRHFEEEVKRGRLSFYGVSSNTLGAPRGDAEATDVERFVKAARDAGGEQHHFKVVELPMNLLEAGPALEHDTGAGGSATAVQAAEANGLAVLVNRPLNAILGNRLVRLSDPPEYADAPSFSDQLQVVKDLEREFSQTIAAGLKFAEQNAPKPGDIFRWGEQLAAVGAELDGLEQWRDLESQAVAPRIMQTVAALDRGITGPLAARWQAWRERYVEQIDLLLLAMRKRAADRSRRRTLAIARAIDPLLPAERRAAPLSQKALSVVRSVPGVTTVLVGMRETPYVADALAMMGAPPLDAPDAILRAASAVELP
ncbi:MAG TPA: aldo/keto reductase [Polyangiaceae bacterium]|nr:aldo/keto reductase [Polyangiaceae bacterium]